MKRIILISSAFLLAVAAMSGCAKVEKEYAYLYLDVANVSFDADGQVPAVIKVTATDEWNVEPTASWLSVGEKTDDSVTIVAESNDTESEREASVIFTLGDKVREEIAVNQLAMSLGGYVYRFPSDFDMGACMSPNGKYVAGVNQALQSDETFNRQIFIIDVEKDERKLVLEVPSSLYQFEKVMAVTDQGVAFVYDAANSSTLGVDLDGNIIDVPTPEGFYKENGVVQGVSADGTVWVGYARSQAGDGGLRYPLIWRNGEPEILPMPEDNARGGKIISGIMARGCSHDGSVIYGSLWDNMYFTMCYWKDGEFHWVAEDYMELDEVTHEDATGQMVTETILDAMICTAETFNISPNGRWICGTWREELEPAVASASYPAVFDIENNKLYKVQELSGAFKHVTNEGLAFSIAGLMSNGGSVADVESGAILGDMYTWIQDNYGIATSPGSIVYMTPDMQKFIALYIEDSASGGRTCNWYVAPRPVK